MHFCLASVLQNWGPYHRATNEKRVPFWERFRPHLYFFSVLLRATLQSVISFTQAHFLAICSSRLHASMYSIALTWTCPGVTWQIRITKPNRNTLNHILHRPATNVSFVSHESLLPGSSSCAGNGSNVTAWGSWPFTSPSSPERNLWFQ